jgi:hypothetical protein
LKENVGKSNDEAQHHGDQNVGGKLPAHRDILQLKRGSKAEAIVQTNQIGHVTKKAIRDKVGAFGCKNQYIKDKTFEHKGNRAKCKNGYKRFYKSPPQLFEVLQKCHLIGVSHLFY